MTREELNQKLDALEAGPHDYSSMAEAMASAALEAFNYMADKMGATGFQASWAELSFLKQSRRIEAPFMLVTLDNFLYPQYDLHGKLEEFIQNNMDWVREEAAKNLQDKEGASQEVIDHWRLLANA